MASRTKEECRAEALKYATRIDFSRGAHAVYKYASVRHWLDDICSHMVRNYAGSKTKEECAVAALKYTTRGEFYAGSCAEYAYAWRYDWLDDICGHMVSRRVSDRLIYRIYSLSIKTQYIGLTNDLKNRFNGRGGHRSGVSPKITLLLAQPDVEIDTIHEFCDQETAGELEKLEIAKAHAMPGWTTLNKRKGGQL